VSLDFAGLPLVTNLLSVSESLPSHTLSSPPPLSPPSESLYGTQINFQSTLKRDADLLRQDIFSSLRSLILY
jgi:hypothetical protein